MHFREKKQGQASEKFSPARPLEDDGE